MGHWAGPKSVSLAWLRYKHSPDTHLKIAKGHENDPIYVKKGVIWDGMKRTHKARSQGKTHLRAYIWVD